MCTVDVKIGTCGVFVFFFCVFMFFFQAEDGIFFFKQKTAYEIYQCDWSSDVCSSDLQGEAERIATEPDWHALQSTAPKTVAALATNPQLFRLTHDDVEHLGVIESLASKIGPGKQYDKPSALFDAIMENVYKKPMANTARSLAASIPSMSNAGHGLLRMGGDVTSLITGTLANWGVLPEDYGAHFAAAMADQQHNDILVANQFRGDRSHMGSTEQAIYSGLESAVSSTLTALLSGGAASPEAVMLGTMGAQTGGQSYGKYRDANLSIPQALTGAANDAMIEVFTEKLPVHWFFKDLHAGSSIGKIMMHQLATEIPGEQVATMLQDLNEWMQIHPDKPFSAYLAERPEAAYQTLVATLVTTGIQSGLSGSVRGVMGASGHLDDATRAANGQHAAEALQLLGEQVAQAKLSERGPDAMQEYLQEVLKDGPVDNVYIDAHQFAKYFQERDIDLQKAAESMPSVKAQLDDALATNGDLRIPLPEYLNTLGKSEHNQALAQYARFRPEDMSASEATLWQEQAGENFKHEADRVFNERKTDDAFQQSADTVFNNVMSQLQTAGRFTSDVNKSYATLVKAFYAVTADQLGVMPAEVFAKYPLNIQAQSPVEGQQFDQHMSIFDPNMLYQDDIKSKLGIDVSEITDEQEKQRIFDDYRRRLDAARSPAGAPGPGLHAEYDIYPTIGDGSPAPGWASATRIRGKDGQPFIVHRGAHLPLSPEDFNTDRLGYTSGNPSAGLGVWFTSAHGEAKSYGTPDSVYLDIRKPKVIKIEDLPGFDSVQGAVAFSKELQAQGYDGIAIEARHLRGPIHFVAFSPDQVIKTSPQGGDLYQQKRGSITFGPDITATPSTVTLLQDANLSTFLHEMGHFFLEVKNHIAQQADAPAEVKADMQHLMQWFGVESLEKWQGMSLDEKRPYHEQFARGFEAYLFEGKAPNPELRGLFSRFRTWLMNVYPKFKSPLNDDVRQVFDRMLATSEQIKVAELENHYRPLFESAEQAGMNEQEWQDYQGLAADAREQAIEDLQHRSLLDMQWLSNAKGRVMRQLQREAAAKRKAIHAEVADEVKQQPVYRAKRFLKRGEITTPDGEQVKAEAGHRLDINALKEMYPEGALTPAPDWQRFGYGKYGMLGDKGLHPDQVAEIFGYSSGDELVHELLDARPQKEVIEGLTNQRMLERYGDLVDKDAIERAAEASIHNDARARFVATELRALSKATGSRQVLARAAKAYAEIAIGRKKISDIKPNQYLVAESKAARTAEQALKKGHTEQAAASKRAQLLNNYFYRSAREATSEIDKLVDYPKKFTRKGVRKNIDADYLDQIYTLLDRFDLRKGISLKALKKRKSLADWVAAQQAQGFEPVIDDRLLDEARRQHYKDMPLEELRGLMDTIKNIEHLARLKKRLLTAKDQRELQVIVDDAVQSLEDNAKGKKHLDIETRLPQDEAARLAGSFLASHRKLASILRQMDGFKDGGIMWELLMRPLNTASNAEAVSREHATIALAVLFDTYSSKDMVHMYSKEFVPSINRSMTKMGRLMVAMNMGNEQNRQRIRDGYKWGPSQVQDILSTLNKRDWDFVQGILDYVDSYWPQIAEKEKRVTGLVPEKVQATPIQTPFGEYRGGYFTIKYDDRQSPRAYADAAKEAATQTLQGKYTRATTRRGHTKPRVEEVQRPVRLDFGVIFEHVDQVIHDLAFHEYLIDANRLLGHPHMQDAIIEHYGHEVYKQMQNAITDVAAGDVPAQTAFEKGINWLRTGTSIAAMGWNFGTALLQPLGLSQSIVRIGPKWVAKGISRWARDAASMENTTRWIFERSDFMRLRPKTMQREINEIRNRISDQSVRRKILGPAEDSYFWLMARAQLIADVPTWLGQYEKSMDADGDEQRAIDLADQAVLDSQGGGQIKDLAGIQKGGPLMKLWTNFYSYFNLTYNLAAESVLRTDFKSAGSVGHLAADLFLLYTVPSVLGWALRDALIRGECERGTDLKCVAKNAAEQQVSAVLGSLVGVRELSGVVSEIGRASCRERV